MDFKTLAFVFSILTVTTYGKSLSVKEENTEKGGTVRADVRYFNIFSYDYKSKIITFSRSLLIPI